MKLYDDYQADVQHAMHEIKTRSTKRMTTGFAWLS